MANQIILKRSATPGKVPTTGQLALGEIAINTHDGLIYIKKDNGTASVVQIGGVTSVNGETGSVVLDTGDITENGNLYFTNARARSALSAGSGISYNSTTGAISTAQNLTTAGSPTFAGLTLTGNQVITGNIVPTADNTYSLGSPTMQWKDVYVGPGSLYVDGIEVIHSSGQTMNFTSDIDQNMRITTTGTGVLQLGSNSTVVQMAGTLQITSGKNITDSAGTSVGFGNAINMNSNKIVGLGTPSANSDAATKAYVDTAISAVSTSSISQGNSSVAVVDSGTGTVTVTVDGSTALTVGSSGVVVAGNFTVNGTTTTVNSNTVAVADNILTLNSDVTGTPTQNAGIEVERGDEANTQIRWNEGSTKWTFTNDGAVYYPIAASTTDLAEGTSLYFTDARARGAISASSATGVSFNSTTGLISLGSIPNSSLSNSSITINGTAVSLGGTRTLDSDAISEGTTNLYHTTARARSSVSAGTGISYNSTTGVISTSAIPNASLANSKVTIGSTDVSLGGTVTTFAGLTSVTSTAFVGALTGNADTATSAGKWTTARTITLAGDLTGSVSIDGSAGVTLTATVAANSVALGTDTTGNYMADVTAGTGITVTHTAGEGSNATIAIDSTVATLTGSQTLTNKTLTSPTINGATIGGHLLPATDITYDLGDATHRFRDLYLSGSTIKLGTATLSASGSGVAMSSVALSGSTSGTVTLTAPAVAGTTAISFPATAGTVITTGDTGTVTNTMLAGSIANAKLSNSSVTVGSTAISLGSSATTLAGLTSVTSTGFTGALTGNASTATTLQTARTINGVSFDGSANVTVHTSGTGISVSGTTVAIDTATTVDKTTAQTLTNKSLSDSTTYIIDETDGTKKLQFQVSGITTGTTRTLTAPDVSGTIITTGDTGTVTNTMLAGSIANAKLSNSTISGVALGSNLNTLTIGTGLSGTSYNGSGAVTIANTGVLSVNGNTGAVTGIANASDVHYIGTTSVALNRTSANLALTGISSVTLPGSTSGTVQLIPTAAVGVGTVLTIPATTGTIVTTGDTGTVTNTMLAGSIANAKLTNSSVTVTAGTGLSGGGAVSLGGSVTLTNAGVTSLTTSSGLSTNTSATGAVSITNTGVLTVATSTGISTSASSGAITLTNTGVTSAVAGTDISVSGATGAVTINNTATLSTVTGRGATTGSAISITNATASTSKITGALIVTGGVGVSGAMYVGGEVTAYASDAALKTNVVAIGDALSKVEAIRGVSYDWNEAGVALGLGTDKQIGVIAQEVEAVLPELVVQSAHEGYKTVKYDKLTALLIEAVKDLSAKVKTLEAQLGNKSL